MYHKAYRQKQLAERADAKRAAQQPRVRGSGRGADDVVAGRNAVVEALAEQVPSVEMRVATDIEYDGRVREALQRCAEQDSRQGGRSSAAGQLHRRRGAPGRRSCAGAVRVCGPP
ncbi:hypothetical protein [Nesterenkonia pannonica]|uniref:hypothetical protein n=1 Tax=Nesterenkonia pannonica TaxID=1548602 RepID=UPI00216443B7|nr:hypothetical protein [Nesterenkonia pannonica]